LFRNRSGFSVVEAIIVASIVGILATFAMPAAERSLQPLKADRAAAAMAADLQNAFALAARQRKPVRVAFWDDPERMTVRDRNTNNLIYRRYYGRRESPYGVTLMAASTNPIFVFPNGVASSATTITLRVGQIQRQVVMSRVGHISIVGS
jgi:type II secretory pathway pseudopilin PulG